jgi:hypothetical protein
VLLLLLLSDPLSRRALRLLFDYILKNGEWEYLSLANRGWMPLFTEKPRRFVPGSPVPALSILGN